LIINAGEAPTPDLLRRIAGGFGHLNGVLALRTSGYTSSYDAFPLTPAGKAAVKPGKNLVAIHCRQTQGGQYIDFGLVDVGVQ
jgi:hypothetical protein